MVHLTRRGRGEHKNRDRHPPSAVSNNDAERRKTHPLPPHYRNRPCSAHPGARRIGRLEAISLSIAASVASFLAVGIHAPRQRHRIVGSRSLRSLSPSTLEYHLGRRHPRIANLQPPGRQRLGGRTEARRTVDISEEEIRRQELLRGEGDHWKESATYRKAPLLTDDCEPLRAWQELSFPTCNRLHEVDRTPQSWASGAVRHLGGGGYNQVFRVQETIDGETTAFVMKERVFAASDVYELSMDNIRMDALIMERLTPSPYVMDVYGHCGSTLVVPLAQDDLVRIVFNRKSAPYRTKKLRMAVQVSAALADIENIDGDGVASYVHQDYMEKQYLVVDGVIKLNDFNKGRLVTKNRTSGELCTFEGYGKDGMFRSPEEFRGERLTAKTQVFSLGNILYSILTGRKVWRDVSDGAAGQMIAEGKRRPFPKDMVDNSDPIDVALMQAIDVCFVFDPKKRPSAMDVTKFLRDRAKSLHVDLSI